MTYEQFKNQIVISLSKKFAGNTSVVIEKIKKNNSIMLDGLLIKEKNINISPTIYLENFFKHYEQGQTFDEVLNEIIRVYENNKYNENFDLKNLEDIEKVKDNIIFKLVNKELNEETLTEVPSVDYLDLAIVFYYILPKSFSDDGQSSILIHNQFLKLWDIDANGLYELAKKNTPRLMGIHMEGILETIESALSGEDISELFEYREMYKPVLVISNENKINGASTILYEDTLSDAAAKLESDLYIIPCSVHEVIVIASKDFDSTWVKDMKESIKYVNYTEVRAQDVLSDNLYFYSRHTKEVAIM